MNVSQIIGGAFDYLGRPKQGELSLGLVLPMLLDSINFYMVDLQLSDENWLLQSSTFIPNAKTDQLVTAPGFSVPVAMEIRDVNSSSETDWQGINIANVTDVQNMGRDGQRAVAFYGTPPKIEWSFDPVEDWEIEARLWYEPVGTLPALLTDSPKISEAFHAMLKIKTALLCAPYMKLDNQEQLALTLTTQLGQWEQKWKVWVLLDRNSQPIQKRDFRGPRRSSGWTDAEW